ncbi:uncharacterized protein BT62DRAFT_1012942 [Guyanagaster necrorhizus]|uniref:Uncharacterized protein n=1 Tax=Guyanagaster necrorhizus TaxID=856835 RepID=A0A9P8AMX2_9AGAR|nr:uncharacterized protein BT62DRAFT_1012942 [Guyanagaster necrorhizus MCA 3950]KAG7440287.1 hypothetical protein BT62DRAFT_1012942 [Guyanagaster necrorhizus MCA 3950]
MLEKAAASVTGVPGSIIPMQMDMTDEEAVKAGANSYIATPFSSSIQHTGARSMAYGVTSFAGRGTPIRMNVLQPGAFASQLIGPEILEIIKTKPAPGAVAPIPARRHGSDAEIVTTAVYLAVSDYRRFCVLMAEHRW